MKLNVEEVTIENEDRDGTSSGYCSIKIMEENGKWLELYGNEVNPSYPLCFDSHKDIDYFCEKLHILLDGKLLPTGFIKE